MGFTGYVYAAAFLIIAVYLFIQAFKNHKILFLLSAYFLFMGGWYIANGMLTDINLFEGMYSWIFRGVALVVLIICAIVYVIYRRNKGDDEQQQ